MSDSSPASVPVSASAPVPESEPAPVAYGPILTEDDVEYGSVLDGGPHVEGESA